MSLQSRYFQVSGGHHRLSCANPHVSELTALFIQKTFLSKLSRDVHMRLGPLPTNRTDTTDFHGIIQLWRKVPNQYQSLVRTHDSPRTESHLPKTGAKGGSPERGDFSTQLDTTTASNMGPGSVDGPVMKKYASSLLVFSGNLPRTAALIDRQLISLPRKQHPVCRVLTFLIE